MHQLARICKDCEGKIELTLSFKHDRAFEKTILKLKQLITLWIAILIQKYQKDDVSI